MNSIIDPSARKNLANCFYLQIPLDGSEAEIKALIADAMRLEQFTNLMLDGTINFEDLLEAIEPFVPSIDNYVSEVESNLNESLIWTL